MATNPKMNSGYVQNLDDWLRFIECWHSKTSSEANGNLVKLNEKKSDAHTLCRNKIKLSKSVTDFYEAFQYLGGHFISSSENEEIGFLKPDDVKPLSIFNPKLIEIEREFATYTRDEQYFLYGIDQVEPSTRFVYLENSIVLGKHGRTDYELILLYPDSLTIDGEMECAILSHAYEFRTPSFAEMMRQLFGAIGNDFLPPYDQKYLKGSCADILIPKDLWWR